MEKKYSKVFLFSKNAYSKEDVDTFSLAACLRISTLDEKDAILISKDDWEYYLESECEEDFKKRNWIVKF